MTKPLRKKLRNREERESSTRKRRLERQAGYKAARTAQKYDANPPTCIDCVRCKRPMNTNGVYVQPFCGLGMFPVRLAGSCDEWEDQNGITIL